MFLSACSQLDKPKKLISKDEMADIFVEMAIYDGALNINPQANMEGTSKYILQQHKITGTVLWIVITITYLKTNGIYF